MRVILLTAEDACDSACLCRKLFENGIDCLVAGDREEAQAVIEDARQNNIDIDGVIVDLPSREGAAFLKSSSLPAMAITDSESCAGLRNTMSIAVASRTAPDDVVSVARRALRKAAVYGGADR